MTTKTCEQCRETFEVSSKNPLQKYCSMTCRNASMAKGITLIDRICEQCKAPFKARPIMISKGYGRFCGRACSGIRRQAETTLVSCQQCGRQFTLKPARANDPERGKFCGQQCY
jgi:hypothetical protein